MLHRHTRKIGQSPWSLFFAVVVVFQARVLSLLYYTRTSAAHTLSTNMQVPLKCSKKQVGMDRHLAQLCCPLGEGLSDRCLCLLLILVGAGLWQGKYNVSYAPVRSYLK